MISLKVGGFIVAAFIAGAFLASPELRAYAANTVGSADIINNTILSVDIKDGEVKAVDLGNDAVTSAKIKNGEVKTDDIAPSAIGSLRIKDNDVKSQDLAPDSVGGSEIIGVTKLIFAECTVTSNVQFPHGSGIGGLGCSAQGAASSDNVVAVVNGGNGCWGLTAAKPDTNRVLLTILNQCDNPQTFGTLPVSVIVFDK